MILASQADWNHFVTGYDSISVLSKHGGLAPLRIGLWKDQTPGKANLGYR